MVSIFVALSPWELLCGVLSGLEKLHGPLISLVTHTSDKEVKPAVGVLDATPAQRSNGKISATWLLSLTF